LRRDEMNQRMILQREAQIEKQRKEKEYSVAQAKQKGLFDSGLEAERQFREAVSTGNFFPQKINPWNSNDFVPDALKSKESIQANSAQDRWIESFLRDASGAAIPPSERGAYAKDFFPKAGDTPEVVANKQRARELKMQSALVGATGDPNTNFDFSVANPKNSVKAEIPKLKENEIEWMY
jgi:hypothetical protein